MNYLTNPKLRTHSPTSGYLYLYLPGTTTKTISYPTVADLLAETNPNPNPIQLNSRQETAVVLKGATKIILKDISDNPVWTLDNIEPGTVILDANGNSILKIVSTASAVNHLKVANGATGQGPTIYAEGDDANINIALEAKGTGVVSFNAFAGAAITNIPGSASAAGALRISEQTTNGTNYIQFSAPASLSANYSSTLPSYSASSKVLKINGSTGVQSWVADGTSGQVYTTDGAATTAFSSIDASIATMEAGTSTTAFTSPGGQRYHPSAAKFWTKSDVSGNNVVGSNISAVTDGGTGIVTFTFTDSLSSANYAAIASSEMSTATFCNAQIASMSASQVQVRCVTDTNTLRDPGYFLTVVYGDI